MIRKSNDKMHVGRRIITLAAACALAAPFCSLASPVAEDAVVEKTVKAPGKNFNIAAQSMASALQQFAQQSNIDLLYSPEAVKADRTKGVSGKFSPADALAMLLKGSSMTFVVDNRGAMAIVPKTENGGGDSNSKESAGRQQDNGPELQQIEEMIVTAQRREQNLQDVPMSVSVADPEKFTDVGLTRLSYVLDYKPGFNYVDRYGGPRKQGVIAARGVGLVGDSAGVSIYVDDIPLTSNGSNSRATVTFFDGLLGDVERVELLKGPQGTLYGATSVGGAVKNITRKPALEEFRGHISSDLSSTYDGGFNKLHKGRISVPLIEGKMGLTLSGFSENNAGFVDGVEGETREVIIKDINDSESRGYSADLFYKVSDKFNARVRAISEKSDWGVSALVTIDPVTRKAVFGSNTKAAVPINAADIAHAHSDLYNATFDYDFGWASFVSSTSYVKAGDGAVADYVLLLGPLVDSLEGNPPGTTTSALGPFEGESKKLVHEMRLTSEPSDHLEWIAGYYYADEEYNLTARYIIKPTDFKFYDADIGSTYQEHAVFANVTYYLTPVFDATVGGRYSWVDSVVNQSSVSDVFGSGSSEGIGSSSTDTWLLALRYRLKEHVSLYGRAASGYRPPTSNLPFINPETGENVAPFVEADSLWSYEVGAKGSLANADFTYDVAAWYIDWSNFQARLQLPFGNGSGFFSTLANAGSGVEAYGFEAEFSWRPIERLSFTPNLAYAHSALAADEPGFPAAEGTTMPGVPEWTASIATRYDFAFGQSWDAHVGGGIRYNSGSPNSFLAVERKISDGYTVVDLNAGVKRSAISVDFYITNLFNDDTFLRLYEFGDAYGDMGVAQKPRTVGVVLSVDF